MTQYEKSQYRKGYDNGKQEALAQFMETSLNIQLPFAHVSEEYILGGLISETVSVKDRYFLFEFLSADDFGINTGEYGFTNADHTGHKAMFDLMHKMHLSNIKIDIVTLYTEAKKQGVSEAIGGYAKIAELSTKVISTANIEYHCKLVKQKAMERAAFFFYQKQIIELQSGKDIFAHLDNAATQLSSISNLSSIQDKRAEQIAAVTVIKNTLEGKYPLYKITGLTDIDKILGLNEVQPALIFVTGETGSGKSAFQNTIAQQCHIEGIPLWANSAETSTNMQLIKLLSASPEIETLVQNDVTYWENGKCNANFERILRGQRHDGTPYFTPAQILDIVAAADDIARQSSVIITNRTGYNIERYIAECLKEIKNGIRVFSYDRHELFADSKEWKDMDAGLSLLRSFCIKYNVIIFDFIQMSATNSNKESFLQRLRGGVAASQAAMAVIGIERDENDEVCFHIEKNSYGRTGKFGLTKGQDDFDLNDPSRCAPMRFKFLPMKQIFVQTRENYNDIEISQAPETDPFAATPLPPADLTTIRNERRKSPQNDVPF